jgi:hypothetical protein
VLNANPSTGALQDTPATRWIVVAFAFLTIFGIWPGLTNGQPFFYADTTAYIRGADLAISKVLGERFRTDWAKDSRRSINEPNAKRPSESQDGDAKPAHHAVLAGRSIVYGVLLYLGEISRGMWLSILVQSLIANFLIFAFVIRTLGLSFRRFLVSTVAVCVVSPLAFFNSYLMPDVFAGFLILGFAILAIGWERLKLVERVAISAVILFAVLVHFSHLILLFALTALTLGYVALAQRFWWKAIRPLITVATTCIAVAILWEATFSFAVGKAVGSPPIRPPFIMAKLVSMLGQPAVAKVCESNHFAVCDFLDRFPIDDKTFLWSFDEHAGVFNIADVQTKRLLSGEQARFAFAIVPPNVGRVVAGISLDTLRQLAHINLDEYAYTPLGLQFYHERMPDPDFATMADSLAARRDIYQIFGRGFLNVTALVAAICVALLLGAAICGPAAPNDAKDLERNWSSATWILLAGVVLNAAICGGFSDINNRYEARVIWLVQLSCITGVCALAPHRTQIASWKRPASNYSSVYSGSQCDRGSELEPR